MVKKEARLDTELPGLKNLGKGIFQKTSPKANDIQDSNRQNNSKSTQESRVKNQENRKSTEKAKEFLVGSNRENVNVRLPIELNDWLDNLVKQGKRRHGQKIPKEVWVQAAIELMQSVETDWLEVDSKEMLSLRLKNISKHL